MNLREKISSGENVVLRYYKENKKLFLFAIIIGILTHFVALSNYLINHDSVLTYFSDSSWLIVQGKWFAGPLSLLKGSLAVHYISNVLGLLLLAISAVLITNVFEIKSEIVKRIVVALFITFPSVAVCSMYIGLDYFAATAFLSILAALVAKKQNILCWIISTLLLTFSIGSYQGYVGFAAAIFVFICIVRLCDVNSECKAVVKTGLYYISILVVAMILYYIIFKVYVSVHNIEISSYKGIDNMTQILNPKVLFKSIIKAYQDSVGYIWNFNLGPTSLKTVYLNRFFVVAVLVAFFGKIIALLRAKQIVKPIFACILMFLVFPLSANLIGVLSNNSSFYYVTAYPLVMLIICGLMLASDIDAQGIFKKTVRWVTVALCVVIAFNSFVITNRQYEKARFASIQLNNKTVQLISDIQDTEGIEPTTPILLIGKTPYEFLAAGGINEEYSNHSIIGFDNAQDLIYMEDILYSYITNVLGYKLSLIKYDAEQNGYKEVLDDMPIYPQEGSIKLVNGDLLVKLGETPD